MKKVIVMSFFVIIIICIQLSNKVSGTSPQSLLWNCSDSIAIETMNKWMDLINNLEGCDEYPIYGACVYHNMPLWKYIYELVEGSVYAIDSCNPPANFQRDMFGIVNSLFAYLTESRLFGWSETETYKVFDSYLKKINVSKENLAEDKLSVRKIFSFLISNSDIWNNLEEAISIQSESIIDCSSYANRALIKSLAEKYKYKSTNLHMGWSPILSHAMRLHACLRAHPINPLIHPFALSDPFSPIETSIMMAPQFMISLNNDGILSLSVHLHLYWQDNRRMWTAENMTTPEFIMLSTDEIWHPTIWIDRCNSDSCMIVPSKSTPIMLGRYGVASYSITKKIDVFFAIRHSLIFHLTIRNASFDFIPPMFLLSSS